MPLRKGNPLVGEGVKLLREEEGDGGGGGRGGVVYSALSENFLKKIAKLEKNFKSIIYILYYFSMSYYYCSIIAVKSFWSN